MIKLLKLRGWLLVVIGVLVVLFSRVIVFPGLELVLGIETIVGRENVSYQPEGSYYYTNPAAMMRWIVSVAGVGLLIMVVGVFSILKARREKRRVSDEELHEKRR
jgi:uncharacterized membrane protein HdeD (DUF308 family)